MYASFVTGSRLKDALRYNWKKEAQQKEVCIGAENFIKDLKDLRKQDVRYHFDRLNVLNQQAKVNALHIFLDFHPEDVLTDKQLLEISREYMRRTGLQEQPWLVFRHHDAGHPHLHIVTNRIQEDGTRHVLYRPFILDSNRTVRELTTEHGLRETSWRGSEEDGPPVPVIPGSMPTQRAISRVLYPVMREYRYGSLEEYNAILRVYNVWANPGLEGSRLHECKGLLYSALNGQGELATAPIAASRFQFKPTLRNLERRYVSASAIADADKQAVRSEVDWTLYQDRSDLAGLQTALKRKGIHMVFQQEKDGTERLYYVDQRNKTVFSGAELGENYQAAAVRGRCIPDEEYKQILAQKQLKQEQQHPRHRLNMGGL